MSRCPGQDSRYWVPEDTTEAPCPRCGRQVEFMKDDFSRRCPGCGTRFGDPKKDHGCIEWCSFAADCFGVQEGPPKKNDAASADGPKSP